jgi:hypothetical protein
VGWGAPQPCRAAGSMRNEGRAGLVVGWGGAPRSHLVVRAVGRPAPHRAQHAGRQGQSHVDARLLEGEQLPSILLALQGGGRRARGCRSAAAGGRPTSPPRRAA